MNDANKVFERIARKQMDGISGQAESVSMSDLEKQLEMLSPAASARQP